MEPILVSGIVEMNHLSAGQTGRWGCKGVCVSTRGTQGSCYEIDLITAHISISLLPGTARVCPPIGQTWVDIGAGPGVVSVIFDWYS